MNTPAFLAATRTSPIDHGNMNAVSGVLTVPSHKKLLIISSALYCR
jgi:predicted deacylase